MGLAELLAALGQDAAAAVEQHTRRARADADALVEAARTEAGHRRDDRLASAAEAARVETALSLVAEQRERHRAWLAVRESLLERIRTGVVEGIPALAADGRYQAVFASDLEAALAFLPDGPLDVRAAPPQLAATREILARHTTGREARQITVTGDDTIGAGAVLRSEDGRIEIDATLAGRLDRCWPLLQIAIALRLTEGT